MKLTPLKSVRKFCLDCCGESQRAVKLCPAESCPIHRFRMSKGRIKLRDIRLKCLDCSGQSPKDVKTCPFGAYSGLWCSLYPYRMGKRPKVIDSGTLSAKKSITNDKERRCLFTKQQHN